MALQEKLEKLAKSEKGSDIRVGKTVVRHRGNGRLAVYDRFLPCNDPLFRGNAASVAAYFAPVRDSDGSFIISRCEHAVRTRRNPDLYR
jgi:hypothetical protein